MKKKKYTTPSLDHARHYYREGAASVYDERRAHKPKWKAEHECLTSMLQGVKGTVLDVPVGTGRFLQLYKDLGLSAVGVDYNMAMLDRARCKLDRVRSDVQLRQGDVTKLDFNDYSFDAVVCVRLLHLIAPSDVSLVMSELLRVAKDNVIVTAHLGTTGYAKGRSQVHTMATLLACVRSPWALASSVHLRDEKGRLGLGAYYMVHLRRGHAVA